MEAAQVVENVSHGTQTLPANVIANLESSTMVEQLPTTESQARPLTLLPSFRLPKHARYNSAGAEFACFARLRASLSPMARRCSSVNCLGVLGAFGMGMRFLSI